MPSTSKRPSHVRTFAAWSIASVSLVIAMLFVGILTRQPGLVSAWIGVVCFSLAALGAIATVEIERRARRR